MKPIAVQPPIPLGQAMSLPMVIARSALPFLATVIIALILHFGLGKWLDEYDQGLVKSVGINVMLAVSLTLVNGFTGQFSIGHAGFLGVGGYVAGSITYYLTHAIYGDSETHGGLLSGTSLNVDPTSLPLYASGDALFVGSIIAGGVVAAIVGYLVGLPSLRLRGDYLAIVTLGFGEIVRVLIQRTGNVVQPKMLPWNQVYPGGPSPEGVTSVLAYEFTKIDPTTGVSQPVYQAVTDTSWFEVAPRVGGALGFSATPDYTSIFWVVLFMGITLVVASRLKRSTFGRAFLSIREDEIASEAMGVDTVKYKVRAFVIAAFFAGMAGALYAHFKSMNPNEIGFSRSFDIVIMVVLGGLGSISGAMIAAVIVTLLPEWLRGLDQYRMIIWALSLILMMIFRPQGLLGVREIWDRALWRDVANFFGRITGKRKAMQGGKP
ncbi:MAG: branched-chain amino acid ABC transporter permease [Phycisphaerales bacterium]